MGLERLCLERFFYWNWGCLCGGSAGSAQAQQAAADARYDRIEHYWDSRDRLRNDFQQHDTAFMQASTTAAKTLAAAIRDESVALANARADADKARATALASAALTHSQALLQADQVHRAALRQAVANHTVSQATIEAAEDEARVHARGVYDAALYASHAAALAAIADADPTPENVYLANVALADAAWAQHISDARDARQQALTLVAVNYVIAKASADATLDAAQAVAEASYRSVIDPAELSNQVARQHLEADLARQLAIAAAQQKYSTTVIQADYSSYVAGAVRDMQTELDAAGRTHAMAVASAAYGQKYGAPLPIYFGTGYYYGGCGMGGCYGPGYIWGGHLGPYYAPAYYSPFGYYGYDPAAFVWSFGTTGYYYGYSYAYVYGWWTGWRNDAWGYNTLTNYVVPGFSVPSTAYNAVDNAVKSADAQWKSTAKTSEISSTTTIADLNIGRAAALGQTAVTLATARGDAGIAYVTALNALENSLRNTEVTATNQYRAALAAAAQAHATSMTAAELARVAGQEYAQINLAVDVGAATELQAVGIATAESQYAIAVTQAEASAREAAKLADPTPLNVYEAAYAAAHMQWLNAAATAYVGFAAASAAADTNLSVASATASANRSIAIANAEETKKATLAQIDQLSSDATYVAEQTRDAAVANLAQTRRLARANAIKQFEVAVATAEMQYGVSQAETDKNYQLTGIESFPRKWNDAVRREGSADASFSRSQALANARFVWRQAEAAAQVAFSNGAAQADAAFTSAQATAGQTAALAAANVQYAYAISTAAAESAYRNALVTARASHQMALAQAQAARSAVELESQVDGAESIDSVLDTPWSEFLVHYTEAERDWELAFVVQTLDLADARAIAEATFNTALSDSLDVMNVALAQAELSRAVAGANAAFTASTVRGTVEFTFQQATIAASQSYVMAQASAEHNYDLALAQAVRERDRSASPNWSVFNQAQTAAKNNRTSASQTAKRTYNSAQSSALSAKQSAEASIASQSQLAVVIADLALAQVQAAAQQVQASVRATAHEALFTQLGQLETDNEAAKAAAHSTALADLATTYPSPWSAYASAVEAANSAKTAAETSARQTRDSAIAIADKDYSTATGQAKKDLSTASATADSSFNAAATNAGTSFSTASANLLGAWGQLDSYQSAQPLMVPLPGSLPDYYSMNSQYYGYSYWPTDISYYYYNNYNYYGYTYGYPWHNGIYYGSPYGVTNYYYNTYYYSQTYGYHDSWYSGSYWPNLYYSPVTSTIGLPPAPPAPSAPAAVVLPKIQQHGFEQWSNGTSRDPAANIPQQPAQTAAPAIQRQTIAWNQKEVVESLQDMKQLELAAFWKAYGTISLSAGAASGGLGGLGAGMPFAVTLQASPNMSSFDVALEIARRALADKAWTNDGIFQSFRAYMKSIHPATSKPAAASPSSTTAAPQGAWTESGVIDAFTRKYGNNEDAMRALILVMSMYTLKHDNSMWFTDYAVDHQKRIIYIATNSDSNLYYRTNENAADQFFQVLSDAMFPLTGLKESWEGMTWRLLGATGKAAGGVLSIAGGAVLLLAPEPTLLTKVGGVGTMTFGANGVVDGTTRFFRRESGINMIQEGAGLYGRTLDGERGEATARYWIGWSETLFDLAGGVGNIAPKLGNVPLRQLPAATNWTAPGWYCGF